MADRDTEPDAQAMCLPPRRVVYDAVVAAEGQDACARAVRAARREAHMIRSHVEGYEAWSAGTREFLEREFPTWTVDRGTIHRLFEAQDVAVPYRSIDPEVDEARFAVHLAYGDREGAMRVFSEVEERLRDEHDAWRDITTHLWTEVLGLGGAGALERCRRELAERTLMQWMASDIVKPHRARIRNWVDVLRTGFASIGVEEYDDRYVVVQEPCGTCSRQIDNDVYASIVGGLATLDVCDPTTGERTAVSVYRSHVELMHWRMPVERIGVPWPAVYCPAGIATGPCRVEIMKDPYAALGTSVSSRCD